MRDPPRPMSIPSIGRRPEATPPWEHAARLPWSPGSHRPGVHERPEHHTARSSAAGRSWPANEQESRRFLIRAGFAAYRAAKSASVEIAGATLLNEPRYTRSTQQGSSRTGIRAELTVSLRDRGLGDLTPHPPVELTARPYRPAPYSALTCSIRSAHCCCSAGSHTAFIVARASSSGTPSTSERYM